MHPCVNLDDKTFLSSRHNSSTTIRLRRIAKFSFQCYPEVYPAVKKKKPFKSETAFLLIFARYLIYAYNLLKFLKILNFTSIKHMVIILKIYIIELCNQPNRQLLFIMFIFYKLINIYNIFLLRCALMTAKIISFHVCPW